MFRKKELATVSNLRFIRRTNFILSWVEHEKSFAIFGPVDVMQQYFCFGWLVFGMRILIHSDFSTEWGIDSYALILAPVTFWLIYSLY